MLINRPLRWAFSLPAFYVMISFMIVAEEDEADADVDAEAQLKFSVPLVPQCSVPMEHIKRLQVVVFKGVFL